jgi:radical SAM protein with 4Fe4S-binding SPASM domain
LTTRTTEPAISAYLHAKGAALGIPVGGNFELTARCNFDCPMCYVHLSAEEVAARGKELTARQWISLAEQARDRGLIFALLTGGEPLVRKDFFEIYGAMKEMGLMVSINSNGSTLQGENLARLIEDPPQRVNVSLYGGCAETYKTMCGNDAFDRVVGNIRELKRAGIDVRINVSLTPYNCQDLERIYEISKELKTVIKTSSYMYPPIRVHGDCGHRLSAEDAAKYAVKWDMMRLSAEQFEQRAHAYRALLAVEEKECSADPDVGVGCRAGSTAFWMTWDGRMLPCGMMPGPETFPLETGFSAAWDELRRMTSQIRNPSKCTGCKYRDLCSVCAAVCIAETGSFEGVPEYVCRMTEETVTGTWEAYQESKGE